VTPGFVLALIFIFFTHERKVSGVQPIFNAIDWVTAQRDGWSCSLVKTNRTVRSRIAFENPGRLFIS